MIDENDQYHDFKATQEELKRFGLYIKSHCEAPDFEDEVEAKSKWEAISKFFNRNSLALREYNVEDLEQYVSEIS